LELFTCGILSFWTNIFPHIVIFELNK